MRAKHSTRHALRRARLAGVVALLIYPHRSGGDVTMTIAVDPSALPTRLELENGHDDAIDVFVLYDDSDAPRFVTYVYQGTLDDPAPTRTGPPRTQQGPLTSRGEAAA